MIAALGVVLILVAGALFVLVGRRMERLERSHAGAARPTISLQRAPEPATRLYVGERLDLAKLALNSGRPVASDMHEAGGCYEVLRRGDTIEFHQDGELHTRRRAR